MSSLKRYQRDKFEKRKTKALGNLYIDSFLLHKRYPEEPSDLESLVEILKERGFNGRINIYKRIQARINSYVKSENYEQAALFKNMRDYCELP